MNIRFKLSSKEGVDGKCQITAIYTITPTKRPYFKTGIFVKKDYFKETKTIRGCVKDIVIPKKGKLNNEEYQDVCKAKQQLQEYCIRIEKVCLEGIKVLGTDGITKEWIEKFLRLSQSIDIEEISIKKLLELECESIKQNKKKTLPSFYELGEIYLEEKDFSISHKKSFRVLMRDIRRYELFVQRTQDKSFRISVESITKDTVKEIDSYIQNEYNLSLEYPKLFEKLLEECPLEISKKHKSPKLTARGNNTIVKLRKKFRAFFKWLNDEEYTSNKPFEGFCVGSEKYGDPIYIDTNERDRIANCDMSADPTLAIQRDVFVLQCLIGCRVGDYFRLTSKNIIDNNIIYTPNKTKKQPNPTQVIVPLSPKAREIIAKYKDADSEGRLLPFISAQKYDDAIKEVFKFCGITRNVNWRNPKTEEFEIRPIYEIASSHMARKTFVGAAYSVVKDPNIVGKMSGHVEGSKAFSRYRKIGNNILQEVIEQIDVSSSTNPNKEDEIMKLIKGLDQETVIKLFHRANQLAQIKV